MKKGLKTKTSAFAVGSFADAFAEAGMSRLLSGGRQGVERESQRATTAGDLALTPHPEAFGDKLANPYVTVDFSESQLELITPPLGSAEQTHAFLERLTASAEVGIGGELLWPLSMPPRLPDEAAIPVARFDSSKEGRQMEAYRNSLALRYGKKMQMISGIHFNFSLGDELLERLYLRFGAGMDERSFKDAVYFSMTRNYLRYRWLLIYLFGASPSADATFNPVLSLELSRIAACCSECCNCLQDYGRFSTSLRVSRFGYTSKAGGRQKALFTSLDDYIGGLRSLLEKNVLLKESEFYSPIRPKQTAGKGETQLEALEKRGVGYLEVRILDLDPYERTGISIDQLRFLQVFMTFCLLEASPSFTGAEYEAANLNHHLTALYGRKPGLKLYGNGKSRVGLREWGKDLFCRLEQAAALLDEGVSGEEYRRSVRREYRKLEDISLLPSERIYREMEEKGESFLEFGIRRAMMNRYGREISMALELSTQAVIKEAVARGVEVEVLDRSDNFIRLRKVGRTEYVKQATRTSADTYISPLIMENKEVTKLILKENGINVPGGITVSGMEEAFSRYGEFSGRDIVIKPKSTNFGKGVVILKGGFSESEFKSALTYAFGYDSSVMIEDFIQGREFRFLVIGEETAAVLHRVPANVTGDGVKSIEELVAEKNTDPLRGKGYTTPLEKIRLGEVEAQYLAQQGKDVHYVPLKDETVFLRENSNISTGGDSIDYTDDMGEGYKRIAEAAAKAVGARICGADIIIRDIHAEPAADNYGVIELNFNPALHIHDFPYKGKNRHVEKRVLDLLGFV